MTARYGCPEGPAHFQGPAPPRRAPPPASRRSSSRRSLGLLLLLSAPPAAGAGTSALPAWKRRRGTGGGSGAWDCAPPSGSAGRLDHGRVPGQGSYRRREAALRPGFSTSGATVSLSRAAIVTGEGPGVNGPVLRRPGREGSGYVTGPGASRVPVGRAREAGPGSARATSARALCGADLAAFSAQLVHWDDRARPRSAWKEAPGVWEPAANP